MERINELQKPFKSEAKTIKEELNLYSIVVYTIGIFIARAMPVFGLAPFGISFLTTQRRFSVRSAICFLTVCIGYGSLLDIEIALKYILSATAYMGFLFITGKDEEETGAVTAVSAAGISIALGRTCAMIWTGFSAGETLLLLCDVALSVICGYAFNKTRMLVNGRKSCLYSMNKEEKLCFILISAIALLGFKSLCIKGFFYSANVIGIWITVVFALCGGGGSGALCGVAVGLVLGFGDNIIEYV